ncbi:MAG: exodeoxyribonuclease VII large subunit [Oligoflexia bacterium]|nr:exodeoxyribonuclease VII large subunit [Oligoflexia bacterium]
MQEEGKKQTQLSLLGFEGITDRATKLLKKQKDLLKQTSLETTVHREPEAPPEKTTDEPLSVTELNKNIKGLLEKSFPMVWVQGEISNFKIPASGHFYFTLKDAGSQIRAVMFRGFTQHLKFTPEDGMEVLVRARITVYEPRGDYQLFCEAMEPKGFGALQIAFEKLKEKLQKEGLFDKARKKALPAFPQRIAIVTSPTGAAIRDMLNVLARRSGGGIEITIIPTAVQGEKAAAEIAQAVNLVSRLGTKHFDVLIVGRGGGSLEDLWSFNEEIVARAVSQCSVPTISAVGHEVDFTICDFVADLRAPTPSAAAELVVKNKADLIEKIKLQEKQLAQLIAKKIQLLKATTFGFSKRLIDPKRKLQDLMLRSDEWAERLSQAMLRFLADSRMQISLLREKLPAPQTLVQLKRAEFQRWAALLDGLSPLGVLQRGYSIVKKGQKIIKDSNLVKKGDKLQIKLFKGELEVEVKN